jgi:hypothetical protein
MICLIAGNFLEAKRWADGQQLNSDEWFYPRNLESVMKRKDFHVLVIGSAGQNVEPAYFDLIFRTAKRQGRLK